MSLFDQYPELQQLMAQMGISEQDRKDANKQAAFAAGFSLLGARKGQEMQAFGNAGLNAMGARQSYLASIPQGKLQQLEGATKAMSISQQLKMLKDQQDYQSFLQSGATPPPASGASPTAMSQFAAPALPQGVSNVLNDASSGLPQVSQLSQAPPPLPPSSIQSPTQGSDPYTQLMTKAAQADAFAQKSGNQAAAKAAEQYREQALKWREKLAEPKVVMVNGKPTFQRFGEYGGQQAVRGDVPPDWTSVDRGGSTDLVNRYNLPTTGASFDKTQTFGDKTSAGQLALAQQRFAYEKQKDAAGGPAKPQWDSSSGQFVYPPTADAPGGMAVSPAGFNKPDKPLTESQAKASAFASQMADASATLARLKKEGFTGSSATQQAAIVNASAEGIPYVPGSAAIPRMMAGEKGQKFQQAELQWTEGALRFMTGANAPTAEVIRNAATYFPRPGDSAAVIKQKEDARRSMEESVRLAAGAGNKQLPAMPRDVRSLADRILAGQ